MIDVLFIVHDVYQEDNQFPLGFGYLTSVLQENGFSVEIYCMDVFHYSNEDLAKKLDDNEYQLIGISFLSARFKETIVDLCEMINKHKKDAWLILGGHSPSSVPEYMLSKTGADVVSVGESETTILEILEDKKHNTNKRIYRNKPIKNLDSIPFPAWDKFPMDRYVSSIRFKGMDEDDRMFQMISARGCINACTFCYRMEKGIRLRSIDNVLDELAILVDKYHVTTIRFQEEMFLVSKNRLREFSDKLRKSGIDIKYYIDARVDFFDHECATILKKSGCIGIDFGFESFSQPVLDYMKKNATVEKNIKALCVAKDLEIPVGLNVIWGYPPDDLSTMQLNAEYCMKYNHYQSLRTIRPVTFYPGCEGYYDCIKKGIITGADDFFKRFRNSDLITMNYTKHPDELCYLWLFATNKMLIEDHYAHTGGDIAERDMFIEALGLL